MGCQPKLLAEFLVCSSVTQVLDLPGQTYNLEAQFLHPPYANKINTCLHLLLLLFLCSLTDAPMLKCELQLETDCDCGTRQAVPKVPAEPLSSPVRKSFTLLCL